MQQPTVRCWKEGAEAGRRRGGEGSRLGSGKARKGIQCSLACVCAHSFVCFHASVRDRLAWYIRAQKAPDAESSSERIPRMRGIGPLQDSRSDHFESCLSTRLNRIFLEGQIGSVATVYWLGWSRRYSGSAWPLGVDFA
jgi:hypothetical protein